MQSVANCTRAIRRAEAQAGKSVRILYGGSVKPENAAELLGADQVGGALVGGASLTAESFIGIVEAVSPAEAE